MELPQGQAIPAASESEAIDRISAILSSKPDAEDASDSPADPKEQAPEQEKAPPEPSVEGEDAPEEKQEDTEVEKSSAEISLDQLEAISIDVTIKGDDGKDVVEKPTIKELREGYMRQKDYSRKTAETARQRDEVPEKIRQGIEGERAAYANELQTLQAVVIDFVAPELKNVDWNKLASEDQFEYIRLQNRSNQVSQLLKGLQTKQQEVSKQQEIEKGQAFSKAAQESRAVLEEKIPGWNDELYQSLMESAKEYGYKHDEVSQWIDPKAFQLLHDAQQFRKMQATKPIVDKRVVNIPRVVKPGSSSHTNAAVTRASEASKKLKSSGRLEDAATVIRSRLG